MTITRIKLAVIAIALVVIGAVGYFVVGQRGPETIETLRVGAYDGDVGALAWIAQEQGFFEHAGLKVEMQGFTTGKDSVDALRKGAVDVAMASEFVVADRSFAETDLRILASVCQYWNKGLLVRRDRGIASAKDLKGKRVGVTFTSTAEHTLVVYLALQGLTINDVKLVDLSPKELIAQMSAGEIDAVMTWEPNVEKIEKLMDGKVANLLPRGSDAYLVTLTTENLLAGKTEAFKRYLRAMLQAEAWVQADPERAQQWLVKRFSLDPAYVSRLWPNLRFAVKLSQEILEIMDGEARWLAQKRGNPNPPDFANTLHVVPLAAVKPAAVTVF